MLSSRIVNFNTVHPNPLVLSDGHLAQRGKPHPPLLLPSQAFSAVFS